MRRFALISLFGLLVAVSSARLARGAEGDAPPLVRGATPMPAATGAELAATADSAARGDGAVDLLPPLDPNASYPVPERVVGNPGDIDVDLATSFPRRNSLLPQVAPQALFRGKKWIYDRTGIQFAFSYQALFQHFSDVLPFVQDKEAAAGILLLEAKWTLVDRGGEYEGSLEGALDWRHALFGQTTPTEMKILAGSGYGTGGLYWEWEPSVLALFWQQWVGKETLELRIGKQASAAFFDFFRFKDSRVSSMSDPVNADLTSVPTPPPGYGVSFKLWPFRRPSLRSLYVVGTLNDVNADPLTLDPSTFFKGQYFYGLEIGYHWKRKFPQDFDHAHVSLWYSDRRTDSYDTPGAIPNKEGWGIKVAGSKQWRRIVVFGKYVYNTAEGGGLGLTWARQTATAGAVLVNPFGKKGEIGVAGIYMKPHFAIMRDQYGLDLYYRVLLTPNLWVTPGLQLVFDPALNRSTDFIAIPGIKFRWFW